MQRKCFQGSLLEDTMALQIRAVGLPAPEREYRFCRPRRFRFDFAWPNMRDMGDDFYVKVFGGLALEIQGGAWVGGRHTRPLGFERDCEKFCLAAIGGWRVLLVTGRMVRSGEALNLLEAALHLGEGE